MNIINAEQVAAYVAKLQANINIQAEKDEMFLDEHTKGKGFSGYTLGFDMGKRYARVWKVSKGVTNLTDRSAFGFIDLTNGNVLKSASWAAPAKGPRGHIDTDPNPLWFYSIK